MNHPSPKEIKEYMLAPDRDLEQDLPADLMPEIRAKAKTEGLSVTQYIRRLMLKDYLRLTQLPAPEAN
jgi:hypothetical protein